MQYHCPSCKINWADDEEPLRFVSTPLCIFCSTTHTSHQLLKWQVDHLDSMSPDSFPLVFRNFYRYVEDKIKILEEKIDGINRGGSSS